MTLWVAVAGAGCGIGIILIARGVRGRRRHLAAVLADLDEPATVSTPGGWVARLWGTPTPDMVRLLAITGRDPAVHATRQLVGVVAGFAMPMMLAAVVVAAGADVPVPAVLVAAGLLAVAGWWIPQREVTDLAASRRTELREATAVWLQLVAVLQAGGAGTESAQLYAAERGDGWAMSRIAEVLRRARLVGEPTWAALDRLGADTDVVELRELAANLRLSDERGAHVRTTLLARARALRSAQTLAVRTAAEQATEQMTFPMVLLLLGFLLFLTFPAFMAVIGLG